MSAADLARALAAHPKFRWAAGMLARYRGPEWWRIVHVDESGVVRWWVCEDRSRMPLGAWPDLADAATAGALLAHVFAARPATVIDHDPRAYGPKHPWRVECLGTPGTEERDLAFYGACLGEAIARALLGLPDWRTT